MKEQPAKKWIAALKNPQYTQNFDQLREPKKPQFSALGLLCEVSNLGYWEHASYCLSSQIWNTFEPPTRIWNNWAEMYSPTGVFPPELLKPTSLKTLWFDNHVPKNWSHELETFPSIEVLNDLFKWNLPEIGNFIEQHWKIL